MQIAVVESHKHLGVTLSRTCSWHDHVECLMKKAWQRIYYMRSFKFVLDRKSLEIIYITFIRPLLEYADVLWDNITQAESEQLERIQHEAARIITGATRLVSISNLYAECRFESLKDRRRKHKLILFYKMSNSISPTYLSSLVPSSVGETTSYSLRNSHNLRNISSNTNVLSHSFLPSTISAWNTLPKEVQTSPSLSIFKSNLDRNRRTVPVFYYTGDRADSIHHARLRMHCSNLNEHLFSKNIVDSPLCHCGEIEDTHHFFFTCPKYIVQRRLLLHNISEAQPANLQLLLFGKTDATPEYNMSLFKHVQLYISQTKRF